MPALKTPVNRHPIGCHTRYTCNSEILYFAPSRARPDFCLKRFCCTIRNSLMWISSKFTSFGGNCNKISFSNLPALKTPVNRHPIGCPHALHSPFQNSLLCAFGRPDFCLKRFYYTIRNSLIWISSKYTSFGGNCNKISFSNLPALKTPVNRHPIGCHTRYTCHSEILYFAPSEDQIFA